MAIYRGPQDTNRRAKNYTHKQAQARLEETIPTFNEQVINSLGVDSVFIDYFHVHDRVGEVCSCRKTKVEDTFDHVEDGVNTVVPTRNDVKSSIILQDDDIFGDSRAERIYEDQGIDVSGDLDYDPSIPDVLTAQLDKDGNVVYQDSVTEGNVDCPICYRTGILPGYTRLNTVRHLLTSLNYVKLDGYNIDRALTPHELWNVSKTGNAYYEILVPKYFTVANYSVRYGKYILKAESIYLNGVPLSDKLLRRYAGTKIIVSTKAEKFTHIVIEFELVQEKLRGNLSAESKALDYNLRDMTADFTVILPPSLHEVRVNDVIVIRDRRLVLKVKDMERKVTAAKKQLEWSVQTRVVQPQEPIKNIYKSFKIG